ncbi:MAG: hypothetical protein QGG36_25910 [Pirellulaceae bacterium]|nr:hypothetical protein [Pirellulaceae bacterium]MDP7019259.1 hypothetical protein [Pirellulaceae bacterium]
MSLIWTIVAVAALGATEGLPSEAVEVYSCNFEHHDDLKLDTDVDYDGWPDGWTRLAAPGFPKYLPIAIRPDGDQPANSALTIDLDGGAAAVYSPLRPVTAMFSYKLTARLRTSSLVHDGAHLTLTFLSKDKQTVETHTSRVVRDNNGWVEIEIGPITPQSKETAWARVGVHLQPLAADSFDLRGQLQADDIALSRLPRMSLSTRAPFNIFHDSSVVEIDCTVSGITNPRPRVLFELLDVHGQVLASESRAIETKPITIAKGTAQSDEESSFVGSQLWRAPTPAGEFGFFRIRASIENDGGHVLARSLNLVVAREFPSRRSGEFGWSLPKREDPSPLKPLAHLVEESAIHWIKLPIWFDGDDTELADRIAWFAERMSSQNVTLVGVLDQPPPAKDKAGDAAGERIPIALVFGDEGVWKPLVNPVMTRLSLKLKWWQLGGDEDFSYMGFPGVEQKISDIRAHLKRFGQQVQIGVNWKWLHESLQANNSPWQFVTFSVDPAFTHAELQAALDRKKNGSQHWVTLKAIPRDRYDVDTRATDLVLRMLAAKIYGADAIFLSDPFNSRTGVMTESGEPSELLLPWRTTASLVNGAKYEGEIQLPGKSHNHVFSLADQGLMVIWSDRPIEEKLYVGEESNVRLYDIWGHESKPQTITEDGITRQIIPVRRSPTFVTGLNLAVAKWRMSFQFDRHQLLSIFGQPQTAAYSFTNPFERGVNGRIRLNTPDVWEVSPSSMRFDVAGQEKRSQSFQVKLGAHASSGEQPVRVDFDLSADGRYRFSVYRSIGVGMGDIVIDVESSLDAATGNLVINVHMTNRTAAPARFNILLLHSKSTTGEKLRRRRIRIFSTGRGRTTQSFYISDGAQFINDTFFIKATEIGGARELNHELRPSE